jgi:hypothetical protein
MGKKMETPMKPEAEDNVVDFDGPDDPYLPLNWPMRKKLVMTMLYSLCTMGTTWASSMSVFCDHFLSLTHALTVSAREPPRSSTSSMSARRLGY